MAIESHSNYQKSIEDLQNSLQTRGRIKSDLDSPNKLVKMQSNINCDTESTNLTLNFPLRKCKEDLHNTASTNNINQKATESSTYFEDSPGDNPSD